MLRIFCEPELRRRGIDLSSVWFQQDEATAHTGRALMSVLREMFPKHVISRGGNVPWPARSPDLYACYYILWGYLKGRVFISKPRTIAEIRQSRKEEIAAIPEQMIRRVMENLGVRLKQFWEMVGDICVTYFSELKIACTEFSSDNNFYAKRWNLIVLFHFENRQGFLPHPVLLQVWHRLLQVIC